MSTEVRTAARSRRRLAITPMGGLRYGVVLGVIILGMLLLAGRIVTLHVIDRSFLQGQGDARVLRTESLTAHRGMITDRHGEPLAISTPVVTLWANPQEVPDDRIQRLMLAQALGMELDELDARYVPVKTRHSLQAAAAPTRSVAGHAHAQAAASAQTARGSDALY